MPCWNKPGNSGNSQKRKGNNHADGPAPKSVKVNGNNNRGTAPAVAITKAESLVSVMALLHAVQMMTHLQIKARIIFIKIQLMMNISFGL